MSDTETQSLKDLILGFLVMAFWLLATAGYVINLYKLFYVETMGEGFARLFGAFCLPVGAIMGWF